MNAITTPTALDFENSLSTWVEEETADIPRADTFERLNTLIKKMLDTVYEFDEDGGYLSNFYYESSDVYSLIESGRLWEFERDVLKMHWWATTRMREKGAYTKEGTALLVAVQAATNTVIGYLNLPHVRRTLGMG